MSANNLEVAESPQRRNKDFSEHDYPSDDDRRIVYPRVSVHASHPMSDRSNPVRCDSAGVLANGRPDTCLSKWLFSGRFEIPSRRITFWRTAWLLLALVISMACQPAGIQPGRTNVAFIIIDTLRADHLSCYGYERRTSPALDGLAESVMFENAIANCSWTRPSISSMLTGVYPRSTGIYKEDFDALSPEVVQLAELFKARGYATVGVTSNPSINSLFGFDRGFDQYEDSVSVWAWMKSREQRRRETESDTTLERADSVTDRTLALLEGYGSEPFYLQVLYIDPHTPNLPIPGWDPPFPVDPDSPTDLYDSEVTFADLHVGRLVDAIRLRYPDTLVVVLSDHGEGLDSHRGVPVSTTHGYYLYDSVLRVPLIFNHPGLARGIRIPDQVQLLDIVPTLAELFELQVDPKMVGTSLVPFLLGDDPPSLPTRIFSETAFKGVDKVSVREANAKLILNRGFFDMDGQLLPQRSDVKDKARKANEKCGPAEFYRLPGIENPTIDGLNVFDEANQRAVILQTAIAEWESRTLGRPPISAERNGEISETVIRQLQELGYLQ